MAEEKRNRPRPTEPWLQPRKRLPPPWLSPVAKTAFLDQRALEQGIRDIISTEDVNLVEVVGYYNFGRQVMKRTRKLGVKTPLNDDLAALIKKWSAQRLKEHILVRIINELFKVDYPVSTAPDKKA